MTRSARFVAGLRGASRRGYSKAEGEEKRDMLAMLAMQAVTRSTVQQERYSNPAEGRNAAAAAAEWRHGHWRG